MIVINCVSYVGPITNSSSEIFVCDTEKSLAMVEDILKDLIATHNKHSPGIAVSFESCFKPLEISKWGFDFWKVPETIRDLYEDLNLEETISSYTYPFGGKPLQSYKSNYEHYDEPYSDETKQRILKKNELQMLLFLEFIKQNEITCLDEVQTLIEKVQAQALLNEDRTYKFKWEIGLHCFQEEMSPLLLEAWDFFYFIESWNIKVDKGNVLIRSLEDNSVPYELFGAINSFLNGEGYHLG